MRYEFLVLHLIEHSTPSIIIIIITVCRKSLEKKMFTNITLRFEFSKYFKKNYDFFEPHDHILLLLQQQQQS